MSDHEPSGSVYSFAQRATQEVQAGKGGAEKIRLTSIDGNTWQTWHAPFPSAEDWNDEFQRLRLALAEDFAGEVPMMLIAETAEGEVLHRCPATVIGRRSKAKGQQSGYFGQGSPDAVAQAAETQARTNQKVLESANAQIDVLTRTVTKLSEANGEMVLFIQAQNEAEALRRREERNVSEQLVGPMVEQLPLLVELLGSYLKKRPAESSAITKAAQGAAEHMKSAAVEAAANGASELVKKTLTEN